MLASVFVFEFVFYCYLYLVATDLMGYAGGTKAVAMVAMGVGNYKSSLSQPLPAIVHCNP